MAKIQKSDAGTEARAVDPRRRKILATLALAGAACLAPSVVCLNGASAHSYPSPPSRPSHPSRPRPPRRPPPPPPPRPPRPPYPDY